MLLASCRGLDKIPSILISKEASALEELAAKEVRRYFYLRTGKLLSIEKRADVSASRSGAIIIAAKSRLPASAFVDAGLGRRIEALGPQEYLLKTVPGGKLAGLLVAGGDDSGVLYGAYRLAERLGVRFGLGDGLLGGALGCHESLVEGIGALTVLVDLTSDLGDLGPQFTPLARVFLDLFSQAREELANGVGVKALKAARESGALDLERRQPCHGSYPPSDFTVL